MAVGGGGSFTYDYPQLERIWIDAGGPADRSQTAAAIAQAESGGNPLAEYPGTQMQPGGGTWSRAGGLWQILGKPAGSWQPSQLSDPLENAKMAVAKYKGAGESFDPWATYTGGQYRQYLKNVKPAKGYPAPPYGSSGGSQGVPYQNPFRQVQGLTAERIDAGVDYSGSGPVYALGPGVITYAGTGNTGWGPPAGLPPGGYIKERLTAGPLKGREVYVAEGIVPDVHAGQKVTDTTVIGHLGRGGSYAGAPTGIETGFAAPGAGTAALDPFHGQATKAGIAYSRMLKELGAPPGTGPTDVTQGSGGFPAWLAGIWTELKNNVFTEGLANNPASGLGSIGAALGSIATSIQTFEQAVAWLVNPSNWVRIICFFAGTGFVVLGVVMMSRTGKSYSVSVPQVGSVPAPGGELAPAMGIAEVTIGAILLFFAFHNTQALGITDFQSLLAYVKDRVHGQAVPAGGQ